MSLVGVALLPLSSRAHELTFFFLEARSDFPRLHGKRNTKSPRRVGLLFYHGRFAEKARAANGSKTPVRDGDGGLRIVAVAVAVVVAVAIVVVVEVVFAVEVVAAVEVAFAIEVVAAAEVAAAVKVVFAVEVVTAVEVVAVVNVAAVQVEDRALLGKPAGSFPPSPASPSCHDDDDEMRRVDRTTGAHAGDL